MLFRSLLQGPALVNNYMENQFTDEIEDPPDHPTDYSLQYQEGDDAEVNEANGSPHLEMDEPEAVKSYFTEGTPLDTPRDGISGAGSVVDLKEEPLPSAGVETPDGPQLYATEGTPGCFSR